MNIINRNLLLQHALELGSRTILAFQIEDIAKELIFDPKTTAAKPFKSYTVNQLLNSEDDQHTFYYYYKNDTPFVINTQSLLYPKVEVSDNKRFEFEKFILNTLERLELTDLTSTLTNTSIQLATLLSLIPGVSVIVDHRFQYKNLNYNNAKVSFLIHPIYFNFVQYMLLQITNYFDSDNITVSLHEIICRKSIAKYYRLDTYSNSIPHSLDQVIRKLIKKMPTFKGTYPQINRIPHSDYNKNKVLVHDFSMPGVLDYRLDYQSFKESILGLKVPLLRAGSVSDTTGKFKSEDIIGEIIITEFIDNKIYGKILTDDAELIVSDNSYIYYALGLASIAAANVVGGVVVHTPKLLTGITNNLSQFTILEDKDETVS